MRFCISFFTYKSIDGKLKSMSSNVLLRNVSEWILENAGDILQYFGKINRCEEDVIQGTPITNEEERWKVDQHHGLDGNGCNRQHC